MNKHDAHHDTHRADNDYERTDANPWLLGGALAVGMLLLGISFLLLNDYFILTKEKLINEVAMKPVSMALRDVQAREELILNSYGVVDSANGIYRIPIERAMKLAAEAAFVAGKGN